MWCVASPLFNARLFSSRGCAGALTIVSLVGNECAGDQARAKTPALTLAAQRGNMKSLLKRLRVVSLAGLVLGLCGLNVQAQQYIYTNDNAASGANSTTALTVNAKGAVKVIKTYSTKGKSAGNGYFALSPITSAKTRLGSCLFVSNGGDSTIAAFQVNLFDGTLATVHGSPFADGVTGAQQFGVGLAVGRNHLLFAGNTNNNSISILRINNNCSLKAMTKVP